MNEANCKISDAEWQIMKVVWMNAPLTTTNIIETLSHETNWSPKTIHSLISRLVKKGALGVNKAAAQYEYFPLVTKEECIRDEAGAFIRKVFDGSFYQMVASFINDDKMTQKEIERLKQILDEKLK